jgi:hypothetical protein
MSERVRIDQRMSRALPATIDDPATLAVFRDLDADRR